MESGASGATRAGERSGFNSLHSRGHTREAQRPLTGLVDITYETAQSTYIAGSACGRVPTATRSRGGSTLLNSTGDGAGTGDRGDLNDRGISAFAGPGDEAVMSSSSWMSTGLQNGTTL